MPRQEGWVRAPVRCLHGCAAPRSTADEPLGTIRRLEGAAVAAPSTFRQQLPSQVTGTGVTVFGSIVTLAVVL
jgi:hypothetical protein